MAVQSSAAAENVQDLTFAQLNHIRYLELQFAFPVLREGKLDAREWMETFVVKPFESVEQCLSTLLGHGVLEKRPGFGCGQVGG
jgi:hypothetical protein